MTRSQYARAAQARDDGLRKVRKLTRRVGLFAVAGTVLVGAKFAHLTAALPHPATGSTSSTGGSGSSGVSSSSGGTSGIPASSGVSSASGGGVATSGGS